MSATTKKTKRVRCVKLNDLDACSGGMTLTTALRVLPDANANPHANAHADIAHHQVAEPQANIAPAQPAQAQQAAGFDTHVLEQLIANQNTLARQLQAQNTSTANALAQARAQANSGTAYSNQLMQIMRLSSLLNQTRQSSRFNDPNGFRDTFGSRGGSSRSSGGSHRSGGSGGGDDDFRGGRSHSRGVDRHARSSRGHRDDGGRRFSARRDRDRGRARGRRGAGDRSGRGQWGRYRDYGRDRSRGMKDQSRVARDRKGDRLDAGRRDGRTIYDRPIGPTRDGRPLDSRVIGARRDRDINGAWASKYGDPAISYNQNGEKVLDYPNGGPLETIGPHTEAADRASGMIQSSVDGDPDAVGSTVAQADGSIDGGVEHTALDGSSTQDDGTITASSEHIDGQDGSESGAGERLAMSEGADGGDLHVGDGGDLTAETGDHQAEIVAYNDVHSDEGAGASLIDSGVSDGGDVVASASDSVPVESSDVG